MSSFIRYFERMCFESSANCVAKRLEQEPDYQELQEEFTGLDAIAKKLGEDSNLMFRLEETINAQAGLEKEWCYHQGYCDCMRLFRWMDAFSVD